MQRIQSFFAVAALVVLAVSLLVPRGALRAGLSVQWGGRGYVLPNQMLFYGVALTFTFFAFMYSLWFVPWSVRAASWHLGLSVITVAVFSGSLLLSQRVGESGEPSGRMVALLLPFIASPALFLLIQGWYLIDALRRCWAILARG
jgi:hypothetical protein